MRFTVENVCGLLIKSKLLTPDGVKAMYDRWLKESGPATENLAAFTRWLVARQYVTEYQAALVAKGHTDAFFLNQYKILERLGRGRMAGVYKAVHNLGQIVAIKVLPPSKGQNPRLLSRFQREVRLALRLEHTNVVRAFQMGEANNLHYLVMEYLEGETLKEVIKRRKVLPAQEAARLMLQALQGLQHIHTQGLVHRDLKPANLMLVPATAAQMPDTTLRCTLKILDIGLGRVMQNRTGQEADNKNLTTLGVVLGTPDYLAPEQAADPRGVDIRADLYSLGCVFYHCLTGQPPFPDTNILSQMVRHATEAPRPPREINPAVPEALQQIVSVMMAKDRSQRYPSPERAAQAVQAFLGAGPEQPKPPEEGPHLRRYLTWLETNNGRKKAASPASREGKSREKKAASKKHRKHKNKKPHQAIQPAPAAVRPAEFDVELVPFPPAASGRAWFGRRDWLFLVVGMVLAAILGGIGVLVARLL